MFICGWGKWLWTCVFFFRLKAINCLRQVSATIELREDQLETILGILEVGEGGGEGEGEKEREEGRGLTASWLTCDYLLFSFLSHTFISLSLSFSLPYLLSFLPFLPPSPPSLPSPPSPPSPLLLLLLSFYPSRNPPVKFVRLSTAFFLPVASQHVTDSTPPSMHYWTISRSTQTTPSPYGSA